MEQSNNKNMIIVLLLVIVLIIGGLCILFATGKLAFNSADKETTEDKLTEDISDLPEWAQYVLKQNITKITYTKLTDEIPNDNYDECPKVELTKNDLAKVFKEMTKYELAKANGGLGFGAMCYPAISVEYGGTTTEIFSGLVFGSNSKNDPEFLELLDNVAEVQDANNGDEYYYVFVNLPLDQIVNDILNK